MSWHIIATNETAAVEVDVTSRGATHTTTMTHEHHWHDRTPTLKECCECGAVARNIGGRWFIELPKIDNQDSV